MLWAEVPKAFKMFQKHVDQVIDPQYFRWTTLNSDFISSRNYFTLRKGLRDLTDVFIGSAKELSQRDMLKGNYFFDQSFVLIRYTVKVKE